MSKIREPAGPGFAVLTILAILFFFAVVAVLINSYDSGTEVTATAAPTVTVPPSGSVASATGAAPVGGVATGGGGMAGATAPVAPVVVGGLVMVTMLGAGAV